MALLAGVPVIGAALVSARLATDTRDRARTADDVGSIEDLADLSMRMTATVDALQTERAAAALTRGLRGSENVYTPKQRQADGLLSAQEKKTDATVKAMDTFLLQRDLTRVSPRLRGDLDRARHGLQRLARERQEVASGAASIAEIVAFYGSLNEALIDATAALTRLSSDGDLLRALSSLVALMHVKECASREHAVLSHTFAAGEFAPGMYRSLVALITEEAVHSATLRSFATARQREAFQRATEGAAAQRSAGMVKRALEATEDRSGVDANDWFAVQQSYVGDLANIEDQYARVVRQTARSKVEDAQRAIRYGATLVIGVIAVSLVLAIAIGRGITRSVLLLVGVAGRVQREKDFSLRAQKSTNDEVGALTEAFNEMLGVIQERDQELTSHRHNLEHVVLDRTRELSQRSDDMRLVLDTVEQGLATIDRSGCLVAQRSRAFDLFFGVPGIGVPFYDHIAGRDAALSEALRLDWQRIVEDARSLDRTFSLAESRITIGESHFALAYKPIIKQGVVSGALLTVSDVTTETAAATARAHLERELQLSQKLEGVGQL
ncbi:MAG: nitrate- and nitrite sensing domain-containing protein, partial [Polyangiaceae bacterium]